MFDQVVEKVQSLDTLALVCFVILGLFDVVSFVYKLLVSIYKYWIRPPLDLKRKLGQWAVITGATDGIGKAYAVQLAVKHGMSIMLISRTESKLQDVKKEILAATGNKVKVEYIVCDYSKFSQVELKRVEKELAPIMGEIGLLINNVGMSYRYPRYFHELPDEEVITLLKMNIDSVIGMTMIVLPGMLERKRGSVVNISSASALYTLPLLAVYSGSKSLVEKFSRSCNAEYAAKCNVTFQCQVPFYVATKLAKMRKSMMVPTPDAYVERAMRWIGYAGDDLVSPIWLHAVQGYVMDQLPEWLVTKQINAMHLGIRKRGIKKDERLAAEGGAKKDK